MNPQQIILALSVALAEAIVARDEARAEARRLKEQVEAQEAARIHHPEDASEYPPVQ